MKKSSYSRANVALLMAMLLTSATMMLWLFWHFPVATAIVTLTVLLGLSISTRWAASTDNDSLSEFGEGETGVQSH